MKIILLNDKQRKAIINMVKPAERDYFSYQNLNLLFNQNNLSIQKLFSSTIEKKNEKQKEKEKKEVNARIASCMGMLRKVEEDCITLQRMN